MDGEMCSGAFHCSLPMQGHDLETAGRCIYQVTTGKLGGVVCRPIEGAHGDSVSRWKLRLALVILYPEVKLCLAHVGGLRCGHLQGSSQGLETANARP